MSKPHTDALIAALKTIPAFATKTWPTMVPTGTTPTLPYLLIHPADGVNTSERASLRHRTRHPRFTGHLVGSSYAQVAAGMTLVENILCPDGRGVVLVVAGERCTPLWLYSPLPIQIDTDVTPALVYQVFECGLDADPVS